MFCSACGNPVPPDCAYCLQCGSKAQPGPAPTVAYVAPRPSPTPLPQKVVKSSWRTPLLYFILGVASVFSGFMLYYLLRESEAVAVNANQPVQAQKDPSVPNTSPSVSPTAGPTVNGPAPTPAASSGDAIWYVMLGGYREPNWAAAETRRDNLKKQGFDAYIVDTNLYQNFDPDLHAVVMGPYSKDKATDVANQIRPIQSDVYIKWARQNR
jgi:SPOR domain